MERLVAEPGIVPLALEFVILCACRTNESLGAQWTEFDMEDALCASSPQA
jgi:hypothetical protein